MVKLPDICLAMLCRQVISTMISIKNMKNCNVDHKVNQEKINGMKEAVIKETVHLVTQHLAEVYHHLQTLLIIRHN
jgi:hypothetical protein